VYSFLGEHGGLYLHSQLHWMSDACYIQPAGGKVGSKYAHVEGGLDILCMIDKCRAKVLVHFTSHDMWFVMEGVKNILLMWQEVCRGVAFGK